MPTPSDQSTPLSIRMPNHMIEALDIYVEGSKAKTRSEAILGFISQGLRQYALELTVNRRYPCLLYTSPSPRD